MIPSICKPKTTTITPPIFVSHSRILNKMPPKLDAATPSNTKTTLNPKTKANPCENVIHRFDCCLPPPAIANERPLK